MLNYIEYLNIPVKVTFILIIIFFIIQVIGELLEFKGKVVPEFVKIRKYFKRKKYEHEIIRQVPNVLKDVQKCLDEFKEHNNNWMASVDLKLQQNDNYIKELDKKIDKSNEDTLSLLIDSKRNTIIEFASKVIDEEYPVTKEQFARIFKIHQEYENIIKDNKLKNGEVDISIHIIKESYEEHMKNHSFVEDVRGYNL